MVPAEDARLRDLKSFQVLDTAPEPAFDRLTALATELFDCPIAVVSLIDEERQWFKSRQGLSDSETPREVAFCSHAIEGAPNSVMVVEDASTDARFSDNPFVTGDANIRFYAGAVLTTSDGFNLGTLCVIDTKARPRPSERDLSRLATLARIVVDELELRRTNRIALNRQHQLEMAESIAAIGTWRYGIPDGAITWSDEVYRIHGVKPGEFDPNLSEALDFYHPEDRPKVALAMERAMAEKVGFEFQMRLQQRNGDLREIVSKATCELDEKGELVAIIGVFQDISDSVRAHKAVQQSEARYRHIAETAPDIITEAQLDGTLTFVSPAALAVTGFTPDELLGKTAFSLMSAADAKALQSMCATVIRSGGAIKPWPIEFKATHKAGHEIWLESRATPVYLPGNPQPIGLTDVLRDITTHKALEDELKSARREAEKAAAVKADFLANMSHELRTPLTAVLGFSRLVAEQPELTVESKIFAERVLTAGKALLATVNDILDFSKLEAGQVEIRPQSVAVAPILRETLDLFEEMAEQKQIALELKTETLPAHLSFDPDRVRQILLNLIGNAVKFTECGSVRVSATYDGTALTVRVKDSGPGIAAERVGELFQRFSQVDGSLTRRHGGTGLGLAICRGLVDVMNGEIGVESSPGAGSSFWFRIPAPALDQSVARRASAGGLPALSECRVLVADDNDVNRKLVSAMLAGHDVQLTEAVNGAVAVELCAKRPFDVILLDMRMPVMGGEDAAKAIRAGNGPNAATPIIAFSADPDAMFDASLFDGSLLKPVAATELIATLANAAAGNLGKLHAAA
ncbi:Sensor histidine kinase RcsC [Alphaproteobacteria bacterium SO-S41]|nr:Sensor histidine kinase RcsC [Alphaproteobacteria bacterium SO-S41]